MLGERMEGESPLVPGYTLDRYELLCPVASGGMASVWLARMRGKRGFEKLFAIKTIKTELSDDPRFEHMFLDEARIASGIQHPNVVQVLDLGEQDGILYTVMEWVDGDSLARVRRAAAKNGATIPLGIALRIVADACAGLHAAHDLKDGDGYALGVVHRDVSPHNILISTEGTVKVIDFGVAKAENRLAPQTQGGLLKGKLEYMAPEQALGRPIDRRADVWAVGICLYELLAAKLPFEAENQLALAQKIVTLDPPRIPSLAEPVWQLLLDTLARDPEARFESAASMRRRCELTISAMELPSTTEDVAAFVETHLAQGTAKRRETVARAIADAAVRAGEPLSAHEGMVERARAGEVAAANRRNASQPPPAYGLTPAPPQTRGAAPSVPPTKRLSARAAVDPESFKEASIPTLGASAIGQTAPPAANRNRTWAIAGAAVVAIALGASLARLRNDRAGPAVAALPSVSAAPVAKGTAPLPHGPVPAVTATPSARFIELPAEITSAPLPLADAAAHPSPTGAAPALGSAHGPVTAPHASSATSATPSAQPTATWGKIPPTVPIVLPSHPEGAPAD
jgi:serine/threonine-protein kinase